ncbi:MAG: phytanoyl-CoA dioxygenase family protein [Myxococcota bacterium]|jgi:chlorinating enzyme|nr:phytanoyl-CoA dioxygenase family protein [Myxococcota bacterium]
MSATHHLNSHDVEAYHEQGFLNALEVLEPDEVAALYQDYQAYQAQVPKHLPDPYKHKVHLLSAWADKLVHHPKILDAVESLLGPDILCWTSNLLAKAPGDAAFVSWHQDSGYWGLEPAQVVTAWVALTPSTKRSGCVQVLPKTHLGEDYAHRDTFKKDNMLTRGQELELEIDPEEVVSLELAPGEMSLHHIKLAHASGANEADAPRVGLAIRYMSTDVQKKGKPESALLVRGQMGPSRFYPEKRLQSDLDVAGRLAHNRALRLQVANNYTSQGTSRFSMRLRLGLKKILSQSFLDLSYVKLCFEKIF